MVVVTFFEFRFSASNISFVCGDHGGFIYYCVGEAGPVEGALIFVSAVAFFCGVIFSRGGGGKFCVVVLNN